MNYFIVLILIQLFLLIFSFLLLKKDLFSPSVLLQLGYLLAVIMCFMYSKKWGIVLRLDTLALILFGIIIFLVVELFVRTFLKKTRPKNSIRNFKIIHVERWKMMLILLFDFITVILLYREILGSFSGTSWNDLMFNFKQNLSFGDFEINFFITIFMKFNYAFSYIFIYIFVRNFCINKMKNKNFFNLLPILFGLFQALLTGSRMPIICFVVFAVICYSIVKSISTYKTKSFSFKNLMILLIIFVVGMYLFYYTKEFVGRKSDLSIFEYLAMYIGGSIGNLNDYMSRAYVHHFSVFYEIFPGLINSLHQFGIVSLGAEKGLEFTVINGLAIGNVYTGLRRFYNIFGYFGVFFFQGVLAFIFSKWYMSLKNNVSKSDFRYGFSLIWFSSLIYAIPIQAMEDTFYINAISFGYVLELFILYICYFFILRIKLKGVD